MASDDGRAQVQLDEDTLFVVFAIVTVGLLAVLAWRGWRSATAL
jgi:hypothetical protein